MNIKWPRMALAFVLAATIVVPPGLFASNHREAPITALDQKADLTDLYAFVSYSANQTPNTTPSKVTIILCVDPFLEPANGPTWFPFDPDILYEIHVDNDHDALADVSFQIRFQTQYQLPGVYTALAGIGDNGANAPGTTTLVVPPQIRDFNNPGLNLRQTYTVTMVHHRKGVHPDGDNDGDDQGDITDAVQLTNSDGSPFFAVPANAGPRTIALHRIGFGLFLIVMFSAGLTAVLIATGMAVVYAGKFLAGRHTQGRLIQRWLPIASATAVTALGLVIALRALLSAGVLAARL